MKRLLGILIVIGGFGLAFAGGAGDEDIRVIRKGKAHVIVIDDDGTRHEEEHFFDSDGPRPFLGVHLDEATDGALVRRVVEGSPAETAGLLEGDVIVGFEGEDVSGPGKLARRVRDAEPGDRVELEILRDGRRETITVEMGERAESFNFNFDFDHGALEEKMELLHERLQGLEGLEGLEGLDLDFDFDLDEGTMQQLHEGLEGLKLRIPGMHHRLFGSSPPKLGVQLIETTAELREHLGGSREHGVLVGKVLEGLPAEDAGIQVGDLIVDVDGEAIGDAGDLIEILSDKDGSTIEVEVIRDGRRQRLDVFIPEALQREERKPRGPRA